MGVKKKITGIVIGIIIIILVIVLIYFIRDWTQEQEIELTPEFLEWFNSTVKVHDFDHPYVSCIFKKTCNGTFYLEIGVDLGENISQVENILNEYGKVEYVSKYESLGKYSIRFETNNLYNVNNFFNLSFIKEIKLNWIKSDYEFEISAEELYSCEIDEDCIAVREGCCGCNSGGRSTLINKKYLSNWSSYYALACSGTGCLAVMSDHWTCFAEPKCTDTKCEFKKSCAEEGEKFYPFMTGEYPIICCEGLYEWIAGMDTQISIEGECYRTGMTAGAPYGICVNCGNGICENIEDICNCPEDCSEGENSDYDSTREFCEQEWTRFEEPCETSPFMKGFPICDLCNLVIDITSPINNSNILTEIINVTATTNRRAICQYAERVSHPNAGGASRPKQMNITDGTFHSQLIENLQDGGHYTVKLNCTDELGNSETDSVKFFVDLVASDYYQVTNRTLFFKYIGDGIGGRIYTKTQLPHLLGDEEFYSGDGALVKSTRSLRLGGTIENSTSNGDLDFPEVLLQIGIDYNDYLYKYQLTFKSTNFSIMHIPAADSIQLFGKYYKVQEGSTNNKIILKRAGSNNNIILENNQLIKIDNEVINGTHVEFKRDEDGIHEITIMMAMQDPNKDYIAVGESYDNPVFPNLRITFESYSTEFGAYISLEGVEL